jgi:hypothetical protein
MIKPAEARKAAETLKAFRKQQRKARPKIQPVAKEQRQVRERDPGFLAYLRRQPCEARGLGHCVSPIDPAHIRYSDASRGAFNPGMGRKNHDRHCNPLCRAHHSMQHALNERGFWSMLGKDAYETAARHFAAYSSGRGR